MVNFLSVAMLAGGLFYLDQFRTSLVEARLAALKTQGALIAGALGEAALSGPLERLALDPELARHIIRRSVAVTQTRVRLFARDGTLVADSRDLADAGREVEIADLPPPADEVAPLRFAERMLEWLADLLPGRGNFPPYREAAMQRARDYDEVVQALAGDSGGRLRGAGDGRLMISAAVPVQALKRVLGGVLVTADSRAIDSAVRAEQLKALVVIGVTFAITTLLSFFLARTIARPIRQLAAAADRVRAGHGRRVEIPDFSHRRDEIGELSGALREMTDALYERLAAIEAFAADVAHELRNPLTSLHSAVETLHRTGDAAQRDQLLAIIDHDVRRLNRLIGDISNASRIDAELARAELERVDAGAALRAVAAMARQRGGDQGPRIEAGAVAPEPLVFLGLEGRFGQVLQNLVDNAVSFSPADGTVRLKAWRDAGRIFIAVEDDGPGIPDGMAEAIFERFYSERPAGEDFGQHSGLGLSIARQIVAALGGEIRAENRLPDGAPGPAASPLGARFVITLPAAERDPKAAPNGR